MEGGLAQRKSLCSFWPHLLISRQSSCNLFFQQFLCGPCTSGKLPSTSAIMMPSSVPSKRASDLESANDPRFGGEILLQGGVGSLPQRKSFLFTDSQSL